MSLVIEEHACSFCGRPATRIQFAAFICDRDACYDAAFEARGGPGGHFKNPEAWGIGCDRCSTTEPASPATRAGNGTSVEHGGSEGGQGAGEDGTEER